MVFEATNGLINEFRTRIAVAGRTTARTGVSPNA
jgi:hypothetical protein